MLLFAVLRSRWALIGASGITLLATGLRLWQVGESLWLDELHTAWCAVGSLDEVAPRAAIGNQSPLFFWLEWLLLNLLGPSELSLRLPSILAGSLLPLAVFLFAKQWNMDAAGLIAAALVALDPLSIFFATEARPYAAVQLFAVIHFALTAQIAAQPSHRLRLTWVALAAVLFYLHYTAALLIASEVVFLAILLVAQPLQTSYRWSNLHCDLALTALLCLPAARSVQTIFTHRAHWAAFIDREPFWTALNWISLPAWWLTVLIVVALVGKRQKNQPRANPDRPERVPIVLLLVCWIAVPLIVAWIATWTDLARLFFPRYVAVVFPAAMLLAGLSIAVIPWRSARLSLGLLTIVVALWSSAIIPKIRHDGRIIADRNEDWRGCVAWLNQHIPQTQFPVLVSSGLIEADALRESHDELLEDYCLLPVTSLYPLDASRSDLFPLPLHEPEKLDQVVEMLIVHRGGAWLIVRGNRKRGQQVASSIIAILESSSVPETAAKWKILESHSFGNVQALLLKAPVQP